MGVAGVVGHVDYHVDAFEGRQDGVEVGDVGLGVWDALHGPPIQRAELVLVGKVTYDQTADQAAGPGYEDFLF